MLSSTLAPNIFLVFGIMRGPPAAIIRYSNLKRCGLDKLIKSSFRNENARVWNSLSHALTVSENDVWRTQCLETNTREKRPDTGFAGEARWRGARPQRRLWERGSSRRRQISTSKTGDLFAGAKHTKSQFLFWKKADMC